MDTTARNAPGTDFILIGAVLSGLGVAFGAFGAHSLETVVSPERIQTFETAVRYQLVHGLGLLLVGLLVSTWGETTWLRRAGSFFLIGVVVFSGSLYLLVLTDTGALGAVTPFGGVAFLLGWTSLAVAAVRKRRLPQTEA